MSMGAATHHKARWMHFTFVGCRSWVRSRISCSRGAELGFVRAFCVGRLASLGSFGAFRVGRLASLGSFGAFRVRRALFRIPPAPRSPLAGALRARPLDSTSFLIIGTLERSAPRRLRKIPGI